MEHTLEVYQDATLIFHSDGTWLYPLFDLESFMAETDVNPADLIVHDKIVGRAAALLMVHLELGEVHAELMSRLGREALRYHNVPHTHKQLVDRITCQTERLLENEFDPKAAYRRLKERANL